MTKYSNLSVALMLGVLSSSISFGQAQTPPMYSRDSCVKVRDGKGQEYAAYLRDAALKLAKVRVDAGEFAGYVVAQAVSPAGRSARCDYHIVVTYNGFPPELSSAEKTAADMKKAGISMSREAMIAKRDELSYLVSTDTWQWTERVGMPAKGHYARLNFYKVHPGMMRTWVTSEATGWKPLAEAVAKEHPGVTWRAATLAMPGGTGLAYNAMTVDGFPSWAAMGKGLPLRATWNKLHPNRDLSTHIDVINSVADRPRIDVVRLIEVLQK